EEAASGMLSRSEENIRLVAESLKSAFNKLYVRELRKDPFLEGLLMLEVIIEPSGEVSFCRIVSSELNHPVLENKIVKRMYLADFGVENVMQTTINIPFPFRPN
ncbi:AgmX/PglI C-terminal domain-containing protein, partial [Oleiphilus sp. HI0061]